MVASTIMWHDGVSRYEVIQMITRFLPLTVKFRLPVSPWLITPCLKEMLVRARPRR